jgi:acyl carrier protein
VRTEAAAVLGLPRDGVDDPERPLPELGLDSLMAVELRNRLAAAAGRDLPATLLFERPTVAALAAFLGAELGNGTAAADAGTEPLDDLSDTEVAALLERKLDAITGGRR